MNPARMLRPAAPLIIAAALTALTGCNTVSGIGHDIQSVGRTLTGGAEETRTAINETVGIRDNSSMVRR